MTTINLKDFFYWYRTDEFVEVPDEVAEELRADKRYEATYHRRMKRNKANFSLDAEDGIENTACVFEPSPEECLALMEQYQRLCCALNHLPEMQGRRIYKCYLLGQSITVISIDECVDESSVRESIRRGLRYMKKFF